MSRVRPKPMKQSTREKTPWEVFGEENFKYRECYKFHKGSKNENVCKYNREPDEHDKEDSQGSSRENDDFYTVEKPSQDFDALPRFAYIRMAPDTPLTKIERLLYDAWKIPKPRIIVSIIGGMKYFKLPDHLETNFINELIGVVCTSDAWLLTNGYNDGIVHLVGQAIRKIRLTKPDQTITAIGICKWGCIRNREKFIKSQDNTTNSQEGDKRQKKERQKGEQDLELNHTHYLMLDDGTVRKYDTEHFRTCLARHIARLTDEDGFRIPVVTIVVEGGRNTLKDIYCDLSNNIPVVLIGGSGRVADFFKRWLLYTKEYDNATELEKKTPLDIDEAARKKYISDIRKLEKKVPGESMYVNEIYLQTNSSMTKYGGKYEKQLKQDLKETLYYDKEADEEIGEMMHKVVYCLQPAVRHNFAIFNLNSDNNLSDTIFRSICQSREKYSEKFKDYQKQSDEREQSIKQIKSNDKRVKDTEQARKSCNEYEERAVRSHLLHLAMDWNCIDVAKELVFKKSLDFITDKKAVFYRALENDLPQFINEFIKLGLDFEKIFSGNQKPSNDVLYEIFLHDLYKESFVNSKQTNLKDLIPFGSADFKQITNIATLNYVLNQLVGDYMRKLYSSPTSDQLGYKIEKNQYKSTDQEDQSNEMPLLFSYNDYILRDLFLWAILLNQIELAKVFLAHMKYRICPALIATKILKKYHKEAVYGELKDTYLSDTKYFEQYAIDCLDKCDDHNMDKACEIVLQENALYGYVTCVQVAADADDKLFLATPCCVQAMTNIWYDKISPDGSNSNKVAIVFSVITLGLLAPWTVTFRTAQHEHFERKKDLQQREQNNSDPFRATLKKNGITYPNLYELEVQRYTRITFIDKYLRQLIVFHQSPCVKYSYHLINYALFLLFFSYVLLFRFQIPTNQIPSIHWTEIYTILILFSMVIGEIHYFFSSDAVSLRGKFSHYFNNAFKIWTLIGFILFIIGMGFRFGYANTEHQFVAARVIMAVDVEIWWLRSLIFIIVVPVLGPHLVAIKKMMIDLGFFILIILIVMFGYGVASRSMYYYQPEYNLTIADGGSIDTSFGGRSFFRQVIYPVYYFLHGQVDSELTNLDKNPNAAPAIATQVILAVHMMFVNVLLLSLLIAIFSKRYDQVYKDTKIIWHYQQYLLTCEYFKRSPLLPPISIVYDLYDICKMIYYYKKNIRFDSKSYEATVFKMISKENRLIQKWYEFEGVATYQYSHDQIETLTKSTTDIDLNEDRSHTTRLDWNYYKQVQDDFARLETSFERAKEDMNKSIESLKGALQKTLEEIKQYSTRKDTK